MKPNRLYLGILVASAISAAYGQESPTSPEVPASATPKPEPFFNIQGTDVKIGSLPPISFHGFASQGYLLSDDYNYMADTKGNGSFQFNEFGLNASMSPFPRTRIAAQAFSFDIGKVGDNAPLLDYGLIDYNFCDELGVRGGRIRRNMGIYNQILDVDVARTSVLLPQGLYQARWRDFSGSVDGGSLYGNFDLGKAGALSYETYAGMMNLSQEGGVARDIQNLLSQNRATLNSVENGIMAGSQIWWNTPVSGLRAGFAFGEAIGLGYNFHGNMRGPGGVILPYTSHADLDAPFTQYSVEYLWNNWTFQAEYGTLNKCTLTELSPRGMPNAIRSETRTRTEAWYLSAAYRFNSWFEVGSYYTQAYEDVNRRGDSEFFQKDAALTFRFDPKPWWTLKLEGHCIDGTGLLKDSASNPVVKDDLWYMMAVKTTFSF